MPSANFIHSGGNCVAVGLHAERSVSTSLSAIIITFTRIDNNDSFTIYISMLQTLMSSIVCNAPLVKSSPALLSKEKEFSVVTDRVSLIYLLFTAFLHEK